jgi:hypothetical protein
MSLPRMHGSGSWCRPVERAWGAAAGARELGCSLFELDAGGQAVPYHAHYANEEWLIVLEGALELRTPEGNREVPRGTVVAFPTLTVGIRPHLRPWLALTVFAIKLGPKVARHPGVVMRALRQGFSGSTMVPYPKDPTRRILG